MILIKFLLERLRNRQIAARVKLEAHSVDSKGCLNEASGVVGNERKLTEAREQLCS